jgi:hypothetical protein
LLQTATVRAVEDPLTGAVIALACHTLRSTGSMLTDRRCCVAANGACGIGSSSVRRRGQRDRASSANATRTRSWTGRSTVIA